MLLKAQWTPFKLRLKHQKRKLRFWKGNKLKIRNKVKDWQGLIAFQDKSVETLRVEAQQSSAKILTLETKIAEHTKNLWKHTQGERILNSYTKQRRGWVWSHRDSSQKIPERIPQLRQCRTHREKNLARIKPGNKKPNSGDAGDIVSQGRELKGTKFKMFLDLLREKIQRIIQK